MERLGFETIKAVHGEFSTGTGLHAPKVSSTEIKSHLLISFLPGSLFQTKMAEQRFLPLAYLGFEVANVFCVSLGPCAVIQVLQLLPQECGLSWQKSRSKLLSWHRTHFAGNPKNLIPLIFVYCVQGGQTNRSCRRSEAGSEVDKRCRDVRGIEPHKSQTIQQTKQIRFAGFLCSIVIGFGQVCSQMTFDFNMNGPSFTNRWEVTLKERI